MTWVAGVDGCKGGWFAVFFESDTKECRIERFQHLPDVLNSPPSAQVIAIDIPIGLLDRAEPGGRACDREARKLLGQPRARSVFSPPVRQALQYDNNYRKALLENRRSSPHSVGISKQAHALFSKIREANALPESELKTRVFEVHPEVCFFQMNDCRPLRHSKKAQQQAGIKERRLVLAKTAFGKVASSVLDDRLQGVSQDDALDAVAACWTAFTNSQSRTNPKVWGIAHDLALAFRWR